MAGPFLTISSTCFLAPERGGSNTTASYFDNSSAGKGFFNRSRVSTDILLSIAALIVPCLRASAANGSPSTAWTVA